MYCCRSTGVMRQPATFAIMLIHDVSQNSSGPSTSGKIPEAFEASFVVAAQPVADPRGTVYLEVGSLLHEHVKHTHHADGNHSGPNPVILSLFARLFELFPFSVVQVLLRWDLICKLFD